MIFSTPVAIVANTTYVASYHTGGGYYVFGHQFQNTGVDNAPLHALRDGVDGPNGVFAYGAGGIFPSQGFNSNNYWADVVFVPSTGTSGFTPSIVPLSGTPQSATAGTLFATALQARVTDGSSNPVSGVTVTFTAPSTGASATFGSSNSAAALTNAAGIATSPLLFANGSAGSYSVTASITGASGPAIFNLTNIAAIANTKLFTPVPRVDT